MADLEAGIDALAGAIADGTPVDWEAHPATPPEHRQLFDHLRLIERVTRAHGRDDAEGAGVAGAAAAHPIVEAPEIPAQIGHYLVEGVLGRGGMGIVYAGRDTRLDRHVAIKALPFDLAADAGRAQRFEREAKLLASMSHPHIATVYGMEVDAPGRRFLVMERVDGEPLSKRLLRGPPAVEEALRWCGMVAAALEAAHDQGVIHRDLKPGNVMVGPGGIKVLDFGLAKRVSDAPAVATTAATGSFATESIERLGTPGYMSPEQIAGGAQDASTDAFAFGCLLFECLTGMRAFDGSRDERMALAVRGEPDWRALPAGVPRAARRLVQRCLDKDPERRPRMGEAREELERIASRLVPQRRIDTGDDVRAPESNARLPQSTTSFVGRERDIEACLGLLDSARLVTLTGMGGFGKTRLALRVAGELRGEVRDGPWFVDLTTVHDGERVAAAVAQALELSVDPARAALDGLAAALADRHALVVLDNCEQVRDGCAELASRLLDRTPVRILATSRERLGAPGEQVYPVGPLAAPAATARVQLEDLERHDGTRLFLERLRSLDPGLHLDDPAAAAAAEVVRGVDGIPLAIELAAARVRVLSVPEIAARLRQRFRLLSGEGGRLERHRKLWDVIAWSYEHLSGPEQALVRALSTCPAGATLAIATAVRGGTDEFETLEVLTRLVEQSVVVVERPTGDESRYRMLETVREYATGELDRAADALAVRDRYVDAMLALAERAGAARAAGDEAQWARVLTREHPNLIAALDACDHARGGDRKALRFVDLLGRFWYVRGEFLLGGRLIDIALARPGAEVPASERGAALYAAGDMALFRGDADRAVRYFEESLAVYRAVADESGVLRATFGLANHAAERHDNATARARFAEALAIARKQNFRRGIAMILGNLAEVTARDAQLEEAIEMNEQALVIFREGADRHGLAMTLNNQACCLVRAGRAAEARERLQEALAIFDEMGARRGIVYGLQSAAEMALSIEEPRQAAWLLGAAAGLREPLGMVLSEFETGELNALRQRIEQQVGPATYATGWAEGRAAHGTALEETSRWLESRGPGGPDRHA